jgi:branched-chain amino acid aminotransferase
VAELNDINLFMIKNGVVFTPFADACLHGITRGLVMEICRDKGMPVEERNLSLTEFYTADEVFGSGTMGELTPVKEMDGRAIINNSGKQVLPRLREYFHELIPKYSETLPF